MNKKGKIIFVCMIFVATATFSQTKMPGQGKMLLLQTGKKQGVVSISQLKTSTSLPVGRTILAPGYYVSQLGFFCKQEIKLEKATNIPFRFRLGSMEDCDRLEGKHRTYRPNGD